MNNFELQLRNFIESNNYQLTRDQFCFCSSSSRFPCVRGSKYIPENSGYDFNIYTYEGNHYKVLVKKE